MTRPMIEQARAAIGLARILADEPERDDELTVTLYWQTTPEALAHLAAALLRDAPAAAGALRRYGLTLAREESSS